MGSTGISGWRLLAVLLLMVPLLSVAADTKTEAELAMLPPYCRDTQGFAGYGDASYNTSPRASHWVNLMGKAFWHMHHYCGALLNVIRLQKNNPKDMERKSLLGAALGDINYSIENGIKDSGPDFVMLPELYWKRGGVLLLLRQDDEATKSFAKAIEAKQDYWPAYAALANYYKDHGNIEKSREFVDQGLKFAPQSKTLNTLREELQKSGAKTPVRKREAAQGKKPKTEGEAPKDKASSAPPQEPAATK